ncbi:MAG: nicotinamide riboside transporter PnuC [Bacteroidales bacterium]
MFNLIRSVREIRFNAFDIFLLLFVLLGNLYSGYESKELSPLALFTSMSGILCVLLAAKGNILNFVVGAFNATLYTIIAAKSSFWGEVMLNMGFYLPMQFVGFYFWSKHLNKQHESEGLVKSKFLTMQQRLILIFASVVVIIAYGYLLGMIKGSAPTLDSASSVLSVIAMLLAIRAYVEQWVLWIVVNMLTVVLWITSYNNGGDHSFIMIAMWGAYFINSIYGYYNWVRLTKEDPIVTKKVKN